MTNLGVAEPLPIIDLGPLGVVSHPHLVGLEVATLWKDFVPGLPFIS